MELKEYSLFDFIENLSSKSPAPGGGGSAALSGAQGMALAAMVCNLTIGKKKYIEFDAELKNILEKSILMQGRFLDLIEEDKNNFIPLSNAYGLPSETEEEKNIKLTYMEEALKTACKTPYEVVELAYEGILHHQRLLNISSKLVISDVGVGVQNLRTAILAGQMNILINTKLMKDRVHAQEMENHISELVQKGIKIADEISINVLERMK